MRSYGSVTNAVIPYKKVDAIFRPIAAINPAKLEVQVFVASTNKAVQAADIRMTIQSAAKGMIRLQVATNGQILNFPLQEELLRENPAIIVNQPKGTVHLNVSMQIPMPDGLNFPYQRLGDGVAEMNKTVKAEAGWALALLVPKVEGVAFYFPIADAGKAAVEIESAKGKQKYTADTNGVVKLKLDKGLLAENPEVKLSEKPRLIEPDMSVFN